MPLLKIHCRNFRNYKESVVEFPAGGAFLSGANGSGKTNLLEAIHMLCTARSQRAASKMEMIAMDAECASLNGEFSDGDHGEPGNDYFLSFDRAGNSLLKINDRKFRTFSEWFGSRPIVSFATGDTELVYGPPEARRRFLDILISLVDKEYLIALIEYRKNLSLRNKLLKTSGDELLCAIYEENMAVSGSIIVEKRMETVSVLEKEGGRIYREIGGHNNEEFSLAYEPSAKTDFNSKNAWKNVFYSMLSERRKCDREMGFSSCGPHRDEVGLFIDSNTAKSYASQGQCRSIALSLKLSAMHCLEAKGAKKIIILFDDAVSELDPERTECFFSLIENRGQVFIASPTDEAGVQGLPILNVAALTGSAQ
jgi:DNA replication and repair protein RecF